jgi:hypothetical protein
MQDGKRDPGNLHDIIMEDDYAKLDGCDHAGDGAGIVHEWRTGA